MLKIVGNKRFIIFIGLILISTVFLLSACSYFSSEKYIETSTSPDRTYTLEAYIVNGGATTDYSIKVYRLNDNIMSNKTLIYNKYHDYDAEINWINNDIVSINGVILDLSKNEIYDWRMELS